jgi:adenylosuccinate lyase
MERMNEEENAIVNVLAERYASKAMQRIWSREEKIRQERRLWVEVMKSQSRLGINISKEQIACYEQSINDVNLRSIDRRERVLKHDLKARIEEFNSLAGLQLIHLALTSRDVTENVELVQTRDALALIRAQVLGILNLLAIKMERHKSLVMVGRTHNVPAQLTTLGKRFATFAEELLFALERLDSLIDRLPLRGIKGPVGTSQDLFDLLDSDGEKVELDFARSVGFSRILDSTGQTYPRSIDFEILSTLAQLSAAPSNLALMVRLMSGAGLLSEGFSEGQVGSSAMPHKVNPRSSERISGLTTVLKGYLFMVSETSGDLWNDGDVSCSVVRRVALPDAFFALDGIFQTTASVLQNVEVFEEHIALEVNKYLPYVTTTKILASAIRAGMDRETAYRKIQDAALASLQGREKVEEIGFFKRLADDPDFLLNASDMEREASSLHSLPVAERQVSKVLTKIDEITRAAQTLDFKFEEVI